MANQTALLHRLLPGAKIRVTLVPTNRFASFLAPAVGRIPGLRTVLYELFFLIRLLRAGGRSDVLHVVTCSHMYFAFHVLPAVLVAQALGRRIVVNYRGGEALRFFSGKGKRLLWVLRKADSVTVPSGYLRDVFHGFGVETVVVPNIVELDPRARRVRKRERPRKFLCTRNLEPYYDVETLVRAFRIVRDRLPDADLTLVGDGSRGPHIRQQLKDLSLESAVTMTGQVSPVGMSRYLADADIFVNASVVDNSPNAILEAFAWGLPVVTTAAGGIPYLVEDGVNGLLVTPGDERALGEGMIRLATDHGLYERLVLGGGCTAKRHSWVAVRRLLEQSYGLNAPSV